VTTYSSLDVPVGDEGGLHVGVWDSDDLGGDAPRTGYLAIHGITAHHLEWPLVAERLTAGPGVRVAAPDLRGRGRSAGLPGPWGMAAHADDLAAVVDAIGAAGPVVVIGHSMGAYVAVTFAHRHPDYTERLVLVDGGLPLPLPEGLTTEQLLHATIGPAAERLAMRFESREQYHDFWRKHPAVGPSWSPAVAEYVDYDLVGTAPGLHSSAEIDAVSADLADIATGTDFALGWQNLAKPAVFFSAPAGMLGQPPGLFAPGLVASHVQAQPLLTHHEVPGVNHYTIVMSDAGADAVVRLGA
jgi:pimeloyl-ACP methyl ester carboxylesterase